MCTHVRKTSVSSILNIIRVGSALFLGRIEEYAIFKFVTLTQPIQNRKQVGRIGFKITRESLTRLDGVVNASRITGRNNATYFSMELEL